ncbi:hypothetical protein [Brucella pecoris]|uniref:phosphoribulokinase n=1 Tax=Brucella pecoris TaxID=867683 RepID=A0A5C5CC62_9HYPH|nr:hypothetical protein [Brucella pecoris]MBB4096130.1 uridine kinase [Brucella pecoris]TNV08877.1 hypothetical protein FIB18_22950 [Brucella pecoris]
MKYTTPVDRYQFRARILEWTGQVTRSPFFWGVLLLKLVASASFGSVYMTELFIPFIESFAANPLANTYETFWQAGQEVSFPYPAAMLYVMALPRTLVYWAGFVELSRPALLLIYRLPLLAADLVIFLILCRWMRQKIDILLWLYWASPVLFYISYIHGQLDVIPVALQFLCVYCITSGRPTLAAVTFGLALGAKTQTLLILPFALVFIWQYQWSLWAVARFLLITIAVFVITNLPFLGSAGFINMVLQNHQQDKIWLAAIPTSQPGLAVYLIPALLLCLIAYSMHIRVHNRDRFLTFTGFAFGIILLFVVPSPGWYFWVLPFFVYFFVRLDPSYLLPFAAFQVFYLAYFALTPVSDFATVWQWSQTGELGALFNYLQGIGIHAEVVLNLVFTTLQTFLLICCCIMYYRGIYSPRQRKFSARPFMFGVAGDSGAGKSTVSAAISDLFGSRHVAVVCGDDMHKWQRGHDRWSELTHLDPRANELHNELHYLNALRQNRPIKRRHYDHNTGHFTEELAIHPKSVTVLEGLHTFYLQPARELFDLKVFVKPDPSLLLHRKVMRDMQKRNYTKETVIAAVKRREADSAKYITTQEKYADIVVSMMVHDPISDVMIGNSAVELREWLRVTLSNSYFLDPLVEDLHVILSTDVHHYYDNDDRQVLDFKVPVDFEDILALAEKHVGGLEEFGVYDPHWHTGWIGVIQLILSYCMFHGWKSLDEN